eukprot:SAG31_NODE_1474_length_8205_cov_27.248335_3_plen_110_part_00
MTRKDRPVTIRVAMSPNARNILPRTASVSCVFDKAGPLGLKLVNVDGSAIVEAVRPGTQAALDHPYLSPGMQLTKINGSDLVGTGYDLCLVVRSSHAYDACPVCSMFSA